MDYNEVNNKLNYFFFERNLDQRSFYLRIEESDLPELSNLLGCLTEDFKQVIGNVVLEAFEWRGTNPYSPFIRLLREWEESGAQEKPPFTGLLYSTVLAAEDMRSDAEFSSTNFYQRYADILGIDQGPRFDLLSTKGKELGRFWNRLNSWLLGYDFRHGRPTAQMVHKGKYVSYALSQALLREEDRRSFSSLFEYSGLYPGQQVPDLEMTLYIDEWIGTTSPTKWLKRIWDDKDIKERISQEAANALLSWEGSSNGDGNRVFTLKWFASLSRSFIESELNILLSVDQEGVTQNLKLKNPSQLASDSFGDEPIVLTPRSGSMVVKQNGGMLLGGLFISSFTLGSDTGTEFAKHARPIIILRRGENGTYYKEVNRLTLLAEHLVLAHESWSGLIESYLDEIARDGYKMHRGKELRGLPAGWVLFQDVEPVRDDIDAVDNLSCLQPIAAATVLSFESGLQLDRDVYHLERPPACSIYNQDIPFQVSARGFQKGDDLVSLVSEEPYFQFEFPPDIEPKPAGYQIVLSHGGREKVLSTLLFRSANAPRMVREEDGKVHYLVTDKPHGCLQGESLSEDSSVGGHPFISGYLITGEPAEIRSDFLPLRRFNAWQGGEQEQDEVEGYSMDEVLGFAEVCAGRGYCIWVCPPLIKTSTKPVRITCSDCGQSQIQIKRKGSKKKVREQNQTKVSALAAKANKRAAMQFDADLAFDSLCWKGSGNIGFVNRVFDGFEIDAWRAISFMKNLSSLGHIDIAWDHSFSRIRSWSISSPTLLQVWDQTFCLSGFRSKKLLDAIKESKPGIRVEVKENEWGPASIYLCDIDVEEMQSIASSLPVGITPTPLKLSLDCSARIADALPSLGALRECLPAAYLTLNRDLANFDLGQGKWVPCEELKPGMAYRLKSFGNSYYYQTLNGSFVGCPPELAKLLSAARNGIALHAYLPREEVFLSRIGCSPNGLYERALVASTGLLPVLTDKGLEYSGVCIDVANKILSKLYNVNG